MMRAVNFLEYDSHYRLARLVGDLRSRLLVYGVGLGVGLGIVIALWLAGVIRVQDAQTHLAIAQTQQHALDEQRMKLSAHLGNNVGRLEPLLPQIHAIRISGPNLADRIAQIGVEKGHDPGIWLDSLRYGTPSVSISGGTRSLDRLAQLVQGLENAGYDPHVTSSTPKQGRGVYFSYEMQMGSP